MQTSEWSAARLSPGQLAYAASDAILAWRLWPIMLQQLQRTRRWDAYELQRRAIPAVADMELRGIGFDPAEHARQTAGWARELAAARREYHELTRQPPPTTPAEVRAWLAQVLDPPRLARWPRTAGGELSIANIHLKRIADIASARPVLALLARAKLLTTFGPQLAGKANPVTGRLHTSYNIAASKAGRFSASGPNFQQFPTNAKAPEFKRCVVAAPDNLLIGADWNQVEMRAAAWISGDRALTRVYAEGRDLHRETAAHIVGIAAAAVTGAQRAAAKPVNFGAIYGIGPASLAANAFADYGIDMSERDAKHALDRFFATYHTLAAWRQRNADCCQRRGYVEIGVGRVVEARWEPGRKLTFPQCCNLPIQGICADAMLRAITWIYARLKATGIRGGLVASVHDELLLEVHEDDAEYARALLEQTMIEAFAATFPGAPTNGVAVAKIGRTWAEAKG